MTGEQLRKGVGVSQDLSDYPPYFEDHQDHKDFCISYRGDLTRIARLTAGLLPDQALAAASRRLQNALHQCSTSSAPPAVSCTDYLYSMDTACHLLRYTLKALHVCKYRGLILGFCRSLWLSPQALQLQIGFHSAMLQPHFCMQQAI